MINFTQVAPDKISLLYLKDFLVEYYIDHQYRPGVSFIQNILLVRQLVLYNVEAYSKATTETGEMKQRFMRTTCTLTKLM